MRRFCWQKNWKNRSAKAMSKMVAKQVNFGQNEFEGDAFYHIKHRKDLIILIKRSYTILKQLIIITSVKIIFGNIKNRN